MKKMLASVLSLACATHLFAEEITSEVIHDYSLVQLNYEYFHDIANSGVNAHGAGASAFYEYNNFLIAAEGGYAWGDDDLGIDADVDFWNISGSLGYIFRFAENHINIIPRFGIGYGELTIDSPLFGKTRVDEVAIHPGITASYAFNNRWSAHAGYSFDYGLESELDLHSLFVGTTVALTERVGLTVRSVFREGEGFAGLIAGIGYHF